MLAPGQPPHSPVLGGDTDALGSIDARDSALGMAPASGDAGSAAGGACFLPRRPQLISDAAAVLAATFPPPAPHPPRGPGGVPARKAPRGRTPKRLEAATEGTESCGGEGSGSGGSGCGGNPLQQRRSALKLQLQRAIAAGDGDGFGSTAGVPARSKGRWVAAQVVGPGGAPTERGAQQPYAAPPSPTLPDSPCLPASWPEAPGLDGRGVTAFCAPDTVAGGGGGGRGRGWGLYVARVRAAAQQLNQQAAEAPSAGAAAVAAAAAAASPLRIPAGASATVAGEAASAGAGAGASAAAPSWLGLEAPTAAPLLGDRELGRSPGPLMPSFAAVEQHISCWNAPLGAARPPGSAVAEQPPPLGPARLGAASGARLSLWRARQHLAACGAARATAAAGATPLGPLPPQPPPQPPPPAVQVPARRLSQRSVTVLEGAPERPHWAYDPELAAPHLAPPELGAAARAAEAAAAAQGAAAAADARQPRSASCKTWPNPQGNVPAARCSRRAAAGALAPACGVAGALLSGTAAAATWGGPSIGGTPGGGAYGWDAGVGGASAARGDGDSALPAAQLGKGPSTGTAGGDPAAPRGGAAAATSLGEAPSPAPAGRAPKSDRQVGWEAVSRLTQLLQRAPCGGGDGGGGQDVPLPPKPAAAACGGAGGTAPRGAAGAGGPSEADQEAGLGGAAPAAQGQVKMVIGPPVEQNLVVRGADTEAPPRRPAAQRPGARHQAAQPRPPSLASLPPAVLQRGLRYEGDLTLSDLMRAFELRDAYDWDEDLSVPRERQVGPGPARVEAGSAAGPGLGQGRQRQRQRQSQAQGRGGDDDGWCGDWRSGRVQGRAEACSPRQCDPPLSQTQRGCPRRGLAPGPSLDPVQVLSGPGLRAGALQGLSAAGAPVLVPLESARSQLPRRPWMEGNIDGRLPQHLADWLDQVGWNELRVGGVFMFWGMGRWLGLVQSIQGTKWDVMVRCDNLVQACSAPAAGRVRILRRSG
jgi:hypothetical protein